jgi:hypothetical protein
MKKILITLAISLTVTCFAGVTNNVMSRVATSNFVHGAVSPSQFDTNSHPMIVTNILFSDIKLADGSQVWTNETPLVMELQILTPGAGGYQTNTMHILNGVVTGVD